MLVDVKQRSRLHKAEIGVCVWMAYMNGRQRCDEFAKLAGNLRDGLIAAIHHWCILQNPCMPASFMHFGFRAPSLMHSPACISQICYVPLQHPSTPQQVGLMTLLRSNVLPSGLGGA